MIYICTSWSTLILRQESFNCLHLVRLGEAWWLMPKDGEAGWPRGDARQLLLLIGDEGTWIHLISMMALSDILENMCQKNWFTWTVALYAFLKHRSNTGSLQYAQISVTKTSLNFNINHGKYFEFSNPTEVQIS